jgi:uncharacterized protein YecA (UPF0149 family)
MSDDLKTAETIDITKSTAKDYLVRYWYFVVIVFICISNVVVWNMLNSKTAELKEATNKLSLQKSLDETNAKLAEVLKRENEIYPKLLETKKELAIASSKLAEIQAGIALTGKETIGAEVSKMDLNALSGYLITMGYPNKVISIK